MGGAVAHVHNAQRGTHLHLVCGTNIMSIKHYGRQNGVTFCVPPLEAI